MRERDHVRASSLLGGRADSMTTCFLHAGSRTLRRSCSRFEEPQVFGVIRLCKHSSALLGFQHICLWNGDKPLSACPFWMFRACTAGLVGSVAREGRPTKPHDLSRSSAGGVMGIAVTGFWASLPAYGCRYRERQRTQRRKNRPGGLVHS